MAASKRKSAPLWISALLLLMVGTASAFADDYPSRPIKIVVPFAAGGGSDLLARLIGQELSASLHRPVIIENRPGAGTQIGAEAVAHAAPDGYTLLSTSLTTYALNPNLYKKLPYDPARDFAPVAHRAFRAAVDRQSVVPRRFARGVAGARRGEAGRHLFCFLGAGEPAPDGDGAAAAPGWRRDGARRL